MKVGGKLTYEAVWKVLSDMVTEFKRRGKQIPVSLMDDLRSAKTLIQVLKADRTCADAVAPQIERYFENLEFYLFSEAQAFGEEFFKKWMQKLNEARKETFPEEIETASTVSRFVPGVSREKHWIRIQQSPETPAELIQKVAEEQNLTCELQEDGYFLVSGKKEQIKAFIKKISRKHESES